MPNARATKPNTDINKLIINATAASTFAFCLTSIFLSSYSTIITLYINDLVSKLSVYTYFDQLKIDKSILAPKARATSMGQSQD